MFENGSSVIKVDFHMHTRKDKEFSYPFFTIDDQI